MIFVMSPFLSLTNADMCLMIIFGEVNKNMNCVVSGVWCLNFAAKSRPLAQIMNPKTEN